MTLRLLRVFPPVYRLSFRALALLAGFCLLWTASPVAGMVAAALSLPMIVLWTRLDRRVCRWQRQQAAPDWGALLEAWQRQAPDVDEETDIGRGTVPAY